MKKSPRRASPAEVIRINQLLTEFLTKRDDGLFEYQNGLSDAKIAAMVNDALSSSSVQHVRTECFGMLVTGRVRAAPKPDASLEARVGALEQKFQRLSEALGYDPA